MHIPHGRRHPTRPTPANAADTSTAPCPSSDPSVDGVYGALADAVDRERVVVIALIDGTRLNGIPLGFRPLTGEGPAAPAATASGTAREHILARHPARCCGTPAVLIREESGQPPFVVRVAHILYVRDLTSE